ncbi:MAG: hypothetical protein ABJM29_09560 [Rhizobiaceae bacterium]
MTARQNQSQHGCAIILDATGLVVLGASGSGKSHLCHQLIDHWKNRMLNARWVADDRIIVGQVGDSYLAHAPLQLQGLAERRFSGVENVDWQDKAVIDLIVQLVPGSELERMPETTDYRLLPDGPTTPKILVPQDNISYAIELIGARIGHFGPKHGSETN